MPRLIEQLLEFFPQACPLTRRHRQNCVPLADAIVGEHWTVIEIGQHPIAMSRPFVRIEDEEISNSESVRFVGIEYFKREGSGTACRASYSNVRVAPFGGCPVERRKL